MRVPIYQVDAFARRPFEGNPAAVMLFASFPDDWKMQAIAAENNLAETAFLVPRGDDYELRWFTPAVEVPLCGHATLASAAVIMTFVSPKRESVAFHTKSGRLSVTRTPGGYRMNFPARNPHPVSPKGDLASALGEAPIDVEWDGFNLLAQLSSAAAVRTLAPDLAAIERLDAQGVIVTARGDENYDFVSRYFAPIKGIPEDPVTGGAHCALAPYWARRMNKTKFLAYQASRRGGEIACALVGDRVELEGSCVFYMSGEAEV